MAWVRIEDNAKAWELYQAGLLWHGDPTQGDASMVCYPQPHSEDGLLADPWELDEWLSTDFIPPNFRSNYIHVED